MSNSYLQARAQCRAICNRCGHIDRGYRISLDHHVGGEDSSHLCSPCTIYMYECRKSYKPIHSKL